MQDQNQNSAETTNAEYLKEMRSNVYNFDARMLRVLEGFNVRNEYSYRDEEFLELKANIKENGVEKAVSGYRDVVDGVNVIVVDGDGTKRTMAVIELLAEGCDIARVPVLLTKKGEIREEDRLIRMFTSNLGKPLKAFEEGEIFRRLEAKGHTRQEIAKKLGIKSEARISNGIRLARTPKLIQNHMASGAISTTTVLAILREVDGDEDRLRVMVLDAIEAAEKRNAPETPEVPTVSSVEGEASPTETTPAEAPKKRGRKPSANKAPVPPKTAKATLKDVVGLTAKTPLEKLQAALVILENSGPAIESSPTLRLFKSLVKLLGNSKTKAEDIANLIQPVSTTQLVDHLEGQAGESSETQEQGEPVGV